MSVEHERTSLTLMPPRHGLLTIENSGISKFFQSRRKELSAGFVASPLDTFVKFYKVINNIIQAYFHLKKILMDFFIF